MTKLANMSYTLSSNTHLGLRIAAYLVVAWCVAVFGYGLTTYSDAPIKACGSASGYCGKTGKLHTAAEFHAEKSWERTLLFSWPLGVLAAIYLVRTRRRAGQDDG